MKSFGQILIRDTLVVPMRFGGIKTVVPEIFCPDDRLYYCDGRGDIHYFKCQGKNPALGTVEDRSFHDEMREKAGEMVMHIHQNREAYIRAWVAATGFHPTECELVERRDGTEVSVSVRRKGSST